MSPVSPIFHIVSTVNSSEPNENNLALYGNLGHCEILFIGDNRASLHAITNRLAKSQTVLNCTKNLTKLNQTHKITLHWIKAHAGHEGNEDYYFFTCEFHIYYVKRVFLPKHLYYLHSSTTSVNLSVFLAPNK